METGDLGFPLLQLFARKSEIREIIGSFTGTHELLPSRIYYDLAANLDAVPVLREDGWDFNRNGQHNDVYSYQDYLTTMNLRYGLNGNDNSEFHPGTATDTFHSYSRPSGTQDDWAIDSSGVQHYYHIYGVIKKADTIEGLRALSIINCGGAGTECGSPLKMLVPVMGRGDGTVPTWSARRTGNGLDYNAPNSTLYPFCSPSSGSDGQYDHLGLTKNTDVQDLVKQILNSGTPPAPGSCSTNSSTSAPPSSGGLLESPVETVASDAADPAYYLKVFSAQSVVISDAFGNSTEPISDTIVGQVPGVSLYNLTENAAFAVLPTTGSYTTTFHTITEPLAIELTAGDGLTTTQAVRYQDFSLPVSVTAILTVTDQDIGLLHYDANADGIFETAVTPTIAVSGTLAEDTEPPAIGVTATLQGPATLVSMTVTDTGSGLRDVYYSLDGSEYQPYTGTLLLNPDQTPVLYAFADDNVANRSSLEYVVPTPRLIGHVDWQGRPAQPDALQQSPVTLTLKSGSVEVDYPVNMTDASGFFTVNVGSLVSDVYEWRIKNSKYLANSGALTLTGVMNINVEMGLMRAGDANNDNTVDVLDFNILKGTFGLSLGNPAYDSSADFNGDNVVDVLDFNLIKGNFGQSGPGPLRSGGP
jgi:hypothetical protein